MSTFSFRRYLPCIDIVNRFYRNIFPNAPASVKYFTTAQQMAQKPYQRFNQLPEPIIHLPSPYRNLLPDEQCGKTCSHVRSNVTKRRGKTGKSSDSVVMRRSRRSRTVFTNEQVAKLENYFKQCAYINSERADELAANLFLDAAPVKYWFKNQRRRVKIKKIGSQNAGQKVCRKYAPAEFKSLHIPSPSPSPPVDPHSFHPMFNDQVIPQLPFPQQNQREELLITRTTNHEPAFNFNNIPYSTRMSSPTAIEDVNSVTTNSTNSDTSDYFSQMSPNSELSEPLTPNSVADSVFNDILDCLNTPKTQPSIANIYERLTSSPAPIFNCAFDTISQSYESCRNATNSTQLTYC